MSKFKSFVARVIVATATLAAVTPAYAGEPAKQSFKHDGYTYVYEVKETATGRVISGRRFPGAAPFTLTVRGNGVQGTSAGQPVNFSLADARGAARGAVVVGQ